MALVASSIRTERQSSQNMRTAQLFFSMHFVCLHELQLLWHVLGRHVDVGALEQIGILESIVSALMKKGMDWLKPFEAFLPCVCMLKCADFIPEYAHY